MTAWWQCMVFPPDTQASDEWTNSSHNPVEHMHAWQLYISSETSESILTSTDLCSEHVDQVLYTTEFIPANYDPSGYGQDKNPHTLEQNSKNQSKNSCQILKAIFLQKSRLLPFPESTIKSEKWRQGSDSHNSIGKWHCCYHQILCINKISWPQGEQYQNMD